MLLVPNGIPPTAGSVSAPVTAMSTSPPRTRAANPPRVISTVARSSGLATRRLASRCERRSAAPERVTPTWARPGRPRSSSSASGPVRRHFQCDHRRAPSDGPELHPHAGHQQRGPRSVDIPQHRIGAPDQLPAARRLARIDAAELPGQPDRRRPAPWSAGRCAAVPSAGGHRRPGRRNPVRIRRIRPATAWRCEPSIDRGDVQAGVRGDVARGRRRRRPRRSPRRRLPPGAAPRCRRRRCAVAESLAGRCLVRGSASFSRTVRAAGTMSSTPGSSASRSAAASASTCSVDSHSSSSAWSP